MRHRFRTSQWLPYPVDFVFAFFANPANLPKLHPQWQATRIDDIELHPAPPTSRMSDYGTVAAGAGTIISFSFRPIPLLPLRMAWVAKIEDFHWNERFCDRQMEGPFQYWRQCHRVQPMESERTGEPGTLLIDTVEYEHPVGVLGTLTEALPTKSMLASLFRHRQQRAEQLLAELSADVESLV